MNKYEWHEIPAGSGYTTHFCVEVDSGIVVAKIMETGLAPYTVNIKNRGDMHEFIDLDKAKETVEGFINAMGY